jgi:lipoprotein-anchoring transpeptidase ErfK/SrfK
LFLLAVPLALAAIGFYATNSYSQKYENKILPGATIAGVDVSGMTRKEAVKAVKAELGPQMSREVKVKWHKQTWKVTPKELGARSDAAAAVERALVASQDASMFDKAQMRWLGNDLDFNEDVALRYPKKGAVSFIAGLAQEFNENPMDASIDYSSGWVEFVKETMGREVNQDASASNLLAALRRGNGSADLEVDLHKPDVVVADFNQVLLLRQSDFKVYMYVDGKIEHEWPVAVGQPQYPTPTGEWTVIDKVEGPTWTNPAPDGWGADMPATIPPGVGNPLGLAAVYWDASGIRFHGTSDIGSIGTAASHGCVRMTNDDVLELYGLVEIGTPIISTY